MKEGGKEKMKVKKQVSDGRIDGHFGIWNYWILLFLFLTNIKLKIGLQRWVFSHFGS